MHRFAPPNALNICVCTPNAPCASKTRIVKRNCGHVPGSVRQSVGYVPGGCRQSEFRDRVLNSARYGQLLGGLCAGWISTASDVTERQCSTFSNDTDRRKLPGTVPAPRFRQSVTSPSDNSPARVRSTFSNHTDYRRLLSMVPRCGRQSMGLQPVSIYIYIYV